MVNEWPRFKQGKLMLTRVGSQVRNHGPDLSRVADHLPGTVFEVENELQPSSASLVAVQVSSIFDRLLEVKRLVERRLITTLQTSEVLRGVLINDTVGHLTVYLTRRSLMVNSRLFEAACEKNCVLIFT